MLKAPVRHHVNGRRHELKALPKTQKADWRALPWPDGARTRLGEAPVPADIAEYLEVEPGTALTVRQRLVGDPERPEHRQLADSWIAAWTAEAVPVVRGDTGMGGLYDRVEEWAGRPLEWREEVSARMPSPDEADALLMPRTGVALLRALRVSVLPAKGGQPARVVEVQDIRMTAGLFAVGYTLPRGRSAKWPVQPATSDYYKAPGTPAP